MNPLLFLRSLSPILRIVLGLVLLIALIWGFLFVRDLFTGSAKVEAKIGTEQAGAAIASGQDATSTVGQQSETEAARGRSVADMKEDVDNAETGSDAHAAGAGWLCLDFGICPEE